MIQALSTRYLETYVLITSSSVKLPMFLPPTPQVSVHLKQTESERRPHHLHLANSKLWDDTRGIIPTDLPSGGFRQVMGVPPVLHL